MRLRTAAAAGTLLTASAVVTMIFCAPPAAADEGTSPAQQRVLVCHETGSTAHAYEDITVAEAGAYGGHDLQHEDLIDPAPDVLAGSCGSSAPASVADEPVATPQSLAAAATPRAAAVAPALPGGSAADGGATAAGVPAGPPVTAAPRPAATDASPSRPSLVGDDETATTGARRQALPSGAVDAGDGSAARSDGVALPHVLGGFALTGAAGAAFAARRTRSRARAGARATH